MSLHCESFGSGPDVVLVHGWGWHGDVWRLAAQRLAADFRVWVPDLPGHGRSRELSVPATLDGWTQAVQASVPLSSTWVGWSLGGLIALAAAQTRHAARVVLIAVTPRFVQDVAWECAWPAEKFARFGNDVDRDADDALERFASLHVSAGASERSLLRSLRTEMFRYPVPEPPALRTGLNILKDADLRAQLPDITIPALVLHGERDQIVPAQAGECMAQALPHCRYIPLTGAGHALPLFHSDVIVTAIGDFAGG